MARPLVSLTVDLDPVGAYHQIHGLPAPPAELRHRFSEVAIPRFLELFGRLGARGTFFAVGDDLASPAVCALLREAVAAGHEVANHTATHPYRFLDLAPGAQARELERAHERIADATGEPPVGFRTPGYHVDAQAFGLLAPRGYRYDSSMLPSWPYYAAKLGVLGRARLRGRRSRSRLHPPTALLAPAVPYRPDAAHPWRRGQSSVVELPAATLAAGMPLVGTLLAGVPVALAHRLGRWVARRPFVTVEFHAIDLVARADGGLQALRGHQPGAELPLARRRAAFDALLGALCADAEGAPLREAAARLP